MTKEQLESNLFDDLSKVIHFRDKEFDDVRHIAHQYATNMCELQKQECLNSAKSHFTYSGFVYSNDDSGYKDVESYIKKDSILNCKNVCDE